VPKKDQQTLPTTLCLAAMAATAKDEGKGSAPVATVEEQWVVCATAGVGNTTNLLKTRPQIALEPTAAVAFMLRPHADSRGAYDVVPSSGETHRPWYPVCSG